MVRVTVSPEGAEEAPSDAWLETLLEAAPEGGTGSVDLLLFSSSTTNTTINTMIKAAIPNTMPKTSLLDFLGGVGP